MQLTIGMMVKNEEKHLDECLKSLQPLLESLESELIIVDTGSTDSTVEIAKKYTDKVYFHKWNDNFSEMRNITISYASGEWFFVVDGDEVLESTDEIIGFFKSDEHKKFNSAAMNIKNYTSSTDKSRYGLSETIRFFKNDGEFRYEGTVHNQPIYKEPTKKILCELEHYGYISDDLELMEKKFIRTSAMLKEELKKDPENIYYRYQLAVSYSMHNDVKEALEEITIAYKQLNKKNKQLYTYVLNEYASILMSNCDFIECEKLCEKELKDGVIDKQYKIDLIYYLAKVQFIYKKYKKALNSYYKYLESLQRYEKGKLPVDLSAKILTTVLKETAYNDIAVIENSNKEYRNVINIIKEIKSENVLIASFYLVIDSFIKLEDYKGLLNYYLDEILNKSDKVICNFEKQLEASKQKLKDENVIGKIEEVFSDSKVENEYGELNRLRTSSKKEVSIYNKIIESTDFNSKENYFGDLIYIGIKRNVDILKTFKDLEYNKIVEFLDFCENKYKDFSQEIYAFIDKDYFKDDTLENNRIKSILCRALLILDKLNKNDFEKVFNTYVNTGIELIQKVYSRYIIENELLTDVTNLEHRFFIYMYKAEKNKNDKILCLRYLKMALKSYPQMNKGIGYRLDEIKEHQKNDNVEIKKLKKQFIDNVNVLLNNGQLEEVKNIIENYKNIFSCDVDIYSVESVLLIMEEKYEDAEDVLLKALNEDETNIDLLYNLGYVYKIQEKHELAYRTYKKLQENCNENELLEEINEILDIMEEEVPKIESTIEKEKIVFFVKNGMDSFIDGIIKEFKCNYETKKVIVTEYNQIDDGMKWADICWFEWCDELISYGSKHRLAKDKKIVCRLHSYEAFAGFAEDVNWANVDKLIFVSEYIKENVLEKININLNKIEVISNEIDYKKFSFRNKTKGYNIAYVGYLNYKKGPMLLIHAFKALYDLDNKYKLYIAGKFQDERYVLYFNQMIEEFGLQDNVFYEGWQSDLDSWLEDKNYILCTSLLESQNISVMQAMTKGIKPLIHNFVGAKRIYDEKYIWSSIDELIEMIQEESFDSKEYSQFVTKNYSKDKTIGKIIKSVQKIKKDNSNITSFSYGEKEINFYLPYKNDHIENVISNTNNFYEIQMLEDIKRRIGLNKVIVDVGANIGNHTVFFANICEANKVYSFEPQKNIYDILCKNVELNKFNNNVNLFNMGVGKEVSKGSVKIIDNENFGMSKLESSKEGNINIDTLDSMLFENEEKIDIIKIDVEGMEMDVLMGAEKILKEYKPILYIEAATDEYFNEISSYLEKFNYKAKIRFNHTPTYLFE